MRWTVLGCIGLIISLVGTPVGAQTVEYIHTDALGSPVATTNSAGQVIDRSDYEPYGSVVGKPGYAGVGFTGHVQDAVTGLTYMQQRYYDPQIGRFLSSDPVATSSGANFNRYSYAANNPYSNTDPDGRRACGKDTTCALRGGARGGVLYQSGGRQERADTSATRRLGEQAAGAANKALEGIADKRYKSGGAAARAWSDRVQRIAEKYNTEIASRLFYDGAMHVAIGSATSDGFIHKVDPSYSLAPKGSGLTLTAGFVHSHPENTFFSRNDLNTAIDMYRAINGWVRDGQFDQTAFVSRPDGRVFGWSVSTYMKEGKAAYDNPDFYDEY